jgi:hypothetical protein
MVRTQFPKLERCPDDPKFTDRNLTEQSTHATQVMS